MFEWAKTSGGFAFAMGQAPEEVKAAATNITESVSDDGVSLVLSALEAIIFSRN
jgi:hydroxymethylpyrimidine pyrophosphatase-like HAD family hydrolase